MAEIEFQVDAYAGYKGEETPRSFTLDGTRHVVADIVGRWYSESHSYFKVKTTDGHRFVLRLNLDQYVWELVMREEDR
jgi:hypothetical protein